jgi:6-phosphogluconolactonase
MDAFESRTFHSADELARAAAESWLESVASIALAGRPHCVALSGGRITLKFFAAAMALAKAHEVSLEPVHFFWADERCVAPDDAESNFAAANERFFQPLNITTGNIHRIRGEASPEQAAELASSEMSQVVPAKVGGQPMLDLIFLGMGEDGHVASLFPGEPESVRANQSVYRPTKNSPKPPPNRVTLGYAAIAAAREVWVLASGAGKAAALRESLRPDGQTPLARVLQSRKQTRIFTDIRLG